jgi:hypothetical protein
VKAAHEVFFRGNEAGSKTTSFIFFPLLLEDPFHHPSFEWPLKLKESKETGGSRYFTGWTGDLSENR